MTRLTQIDQNPFILDGLGLFNPTRHFFVIKSFCGKAGAILQHVPTHADTPCLRPPCGQPQTLPSAPTPLQAIGHVLGQRPLQLGFAARTPAYIQFWQLEPYQNCWLLDLAPSTLGLRKLIRFLDESHWAALTGHEPRRPQNAADFETSAFLENMYFIYSLAEYGRGRIWLQLSLRSNGGSIQEPSWRTVTWWLLGMGCILEEDWAMVQTEEIQKH